MKFCPSDLLALRPWRAMMSLKGSGRIGSGGVGTHDCIFDGHLQRRGHRARIGAVLAGDVEGGTVIWCGTDDGETERNVDRILEMKCFDRDQRLVVVHA